MFNKFIGIIFGAIFSLCFASICYASSDVTVKVDDIAVSFEQSPVIDGGRTLIPLRGVFDALDCEVEWNGASKDVLIKKDNNVVSVKIGDSNVYKNGVLSSVIDVPAKVINGRTMVPVRGILELFDNYVGWNDEERVVEIYSMAGNEVLIDLKDIWEANKASSILEDNSSVQKIHTLPNGHKNISTYSKDSDGRIIAHIVNDEFESYSKGKSYYEKDSDGELYFIEDIIGNAGDKGYLPMDVDVSWSFNEKEKVVFAVEKNGKIYVKTEMEDMNSADGLVGDFNLKNVDKYVCRFIVDTYTSKILSLEDYQVVGGVEKRISGIRVKKNVTDNVPGFVADINNSSDKRKITIVVNSGTLDEKTVNVEVGGNVNFSFFGIENYNVYTDKNCTMLYDNSKYNSNPDILLYIREK